MVLSFWLAGAVLSAPSPPRPPTRPPVEVTVLGPNLLLVRSSYPIQDTYLADPQGRYSFYVEYSADYRHAAVKVRTTWSPLELTVETGIPGASLRRRHHFVIRDPALRR